MANTVTPHEVRVINGRKGGQRTNSYEPGNAVDQRPEVGRAVRAAKEIHRGGSCHLPRRVPNQGCELTR